MRLVVGTTVLLPLLLLLLTMRLVVGATVSPMPTPKHAMVPVYSPSECCGTTGATLVSSGDGPAQKSDAAATPRPHTTSGTSPSRSAAGPEMTETMA